MSNVIHVEFGKRNIEQQEVPVSPSLTAYLDSLRTMGVEEDDILDTLDAINNMDFYFAADKEVQEFANGWLHKFL